MLRLTDPDLTTAGAWVGASTIVREIEAKASGTLARLHMACASRGVTTH
ncbi:hypothetical protein [Brevundimonas olei]